MRHERTMQISADQLSDANEILQRTEFVEDAGRDEVFYSFSVPFGDGIEVDIKVCNGDGPFVDAILFHNWSEVCVMEPCFESLDGEYHFYYEDNEYVVFVEEE